MNNEPTKIKETIQEAKQALPRSRPTNLEEQTFRAWKNQIKAKWLEIAQKELALEGKSLEFDDHYKLYVKAVFATYFSDARECADCNAISRQLYNNKVHHLNLRPHKGLMVLGHKGTGKTFAWQILQRAINATKNIHYKDKYKLALVLALNIADAYRREAVEGLELYKTGYKNEAAFMLIDEMGLETPANYKFDKRGAEPRNTVAEIIYHHHKIWTANKRKKLFLISNKDWYGQGNNPGITDLYQDLVSDRIKQFCNLYVMPGKKSRR